MVVLTGEGHSILLGDDESLLNKAIEPNFLLQKDVVNAFSRLQHDAVVAGFDLRVVSSFRSFDRQLSIWNNKAAGKRLVLNDADEVVSLQGMAQWQAVSSILRFSALPGTSRHHWGTDIDVYDAAAVAPDYQVQLTVSECKQGGPFYALHQWLDERIAANQSYGFFKPYAHDMGGVSPEPWHLSYAPLALGYQQSLTVSMVYHRLSQAEMGYQQFVLAVLPAIMQRFVFATAQPPWEV